LLRSVFQEARAAVAAEASARGHPVGDLATTLLLAVATPDLLAAGQVGDGAIVARLAEQHFQTATRPPAQEFINETTLLTSAHLSGQVQFANLRGRLTGLALFSDGLQLLALQMPHATPHAPFFDPLLRFVEHTPDRATAEEQLRRFLQSPRLAERTDDDLTLVLAARTAG
ncbi:MAG TPA: protein phosphatase 2C domain-containing protein, partial [Gemmataceae bacterium]|nr:protein phosphatase 2C domain-containing protein [Gemmataceae bacterium]